MIRLAYSVTHAQLERDAQRLARASDAMHRSAGDLQAQAREARAVADRLKAATAKANGRLSRR